jgi:transposase
MDGVSELVSVVFSGLAPLVVEDVADEGELIRVRARTPDEPVACPGCGAGIGRVHGYHERTVADVPVDARRVQAAAWIRRLVCPTRGCRQRQPPASAGSRSMRSSTRASARPDAHGS